MCEARDTADVQHRLRLPVQDLKMMMFKLAMHEAHDVAGATPFEAAGARPREEDV